jgi:Uma2 family endonuclease
MFSSGLIKSIFFYTKGKAEMTTIDRLPVVTPADWMPGPPQGQWTYDDYIALPDDGQRYEIVYGVLYMSPSPSGAHQDAVGEIFSYLRTYVKLVGLGLVRVAPFNVRLSSKDTFQPDILVVLNANLEKVKDTYMLGAPDLVVEVASPSTEGFDRREKQDAYAAAGVPEYWIVNTDARTVELLVLEHGKYRSPGVFRGKATLPSHVVPDLPVHVEQFFV